MARRRFRLALWAAALLSLCLVAAHGTVWYLVTSRIMAGFPAFVADAARNGWTVEAGPLRRAGWPWEARVEAHGFAVSHGRGGYALRWQAERLGVAVAPEDPQALRFEPAGRQSAQFGAGPPLAVEAAALALRAPFDPAAPTELSANDLTATAADGSGIRVARLGARLSAAAMDAMATLAPLPALPPPFDGMATLVARATARPALPAPTQADAAAWRRQGGRIDLAALSLQWGPVRASGAGFGGLGPALQPEFETRLAVEGAQDAIDAAAAGGTLQPSAAAAAKAVVGVLSMASPGGRMTAPVDLHGGTLTVAGFPLLRIAKVNWN